MNRVIVLDFDGVIADSINECFLISYWAYRGIEKMESGMFNIDGRPAKELFRKFRYLVGPAHEYYFLLKTVYSDIGKSDDGFLDLYKINKQAYQQEAQEFCERFYKVRKQAQTQFIAQWIKLNPLYVGIDNIIKGALSREKLFIASTKDKASIDLIMKRNGFDILSKQILDKSFSLNKKLQLKEIICRTGGKAENVYFVDDNLTYLINVKPLGVKCFLATWGYNTPEVRQEAEKLGIGPLTIQDLEGMVT